MEQTTLSDGGKPINFPGIGNRSVRSQEVMSMRHLQPRTKISRVLMHENVSQENLLQNHLKGLKIRRQQSKFMHEHASREFISHQKRKERKWKQQDEARLANINLPVLEGSAPNSPGSASQSTGVIYHSPEYRLLSPPERRSEVYGPLLPEVDILPARTEIVKHGHEAFVTKLSEQVQRVEADVQKYDTYCGTNFMDRESTLTDGRFERLSVALWSPDHDTPRLQGRSGNMSRTTSRGASRRTSRYLVPTRSSKRRPTIASTSFSRSNDVEVVAHKRKESQIEEKTEAPKELGNEVKTCFSPTKIQGSDSFLTSKGNKFYQHETSNARIRPALAYSSTQSVLLGNVRRKEHTLSSLGNTSTRLISTSDSTIARNSTLGFAKQVTSKSSQCQRDLKYKDYKSLQRLHVTNAAKGSTARMTEMRRQKTFKALTSSDLNLDALSGDEVE